MSSGWRRGTRSRAGSRTTPTIKGGFEDDAKLIELRNVEKRRLGEPHLRIDVDLSSDRTKIPRNHHGGVITCQALESMYDYLVLLSRAAVGAAVKTYAAGMKHRFPICGNIRPNFPTF